jgi:hypothetical protein
MASAADPRAYSDELGRDGVERQSELVRAMVEVVVLPVVKRGWRTFDESRAVSTGSTSPA